MKSLMILLSLCAILGAVYGNHDHEEKNLLSELIRHTVTSQDSAEIQALKISAILAVARAADADPSFVQNRRRPPSGK